MKKCFIFLLFTISIINFSYADTNSYCNKDTSQNNLKIKNINIKVNNYRKWAENSLRILIGNFRWIPKRYKKRFDASVIVQFENDITCNFNARIRNNGNQKDHIALKGNSIIQSIDVHLITGSIYGITKFKLLRSNTRGNYEDEILLTELLRSFNYLAPRTSYVDAEINEVKSKMLFQEKPAKELLQFNNRTEGPIFEGDERFTFRLAEKMPDNQLSNYEIGMLPLLEKGVNASLARQINSEWISKNEKKSNIAYNSLSNLNLIYLLHVNKYKDDINNFNYFEYNLDNNLLALNDLNNVLKLDIYNLLVLAANGWHGLTPNNRKFYWNSKENFFEPINSDTNANIELEANFFPLPASEKIEFAFDELKKLLNKTNVNELSQKTTLRGLTLDKGQIGKKIDKIKDNLNKLKTIYLNTDPEIIAYNRNFQIKKKMWSKYYESLHNISPNIYLVKQSPNSNLFERCTIQSLKCTNYQFSESQLMELVEGRLIIDGKEYQYLGKNFNEL